MVLDVHGHWMGEVEGSRVTACSADCVHLEVAVELLPAYHLTWNAVLCVIVAVGREEACWDATYDAGDQQYLVSVDGVVVNVLPAAV